MVRRALPDTCRRHDVLTRCSSLVCFTSASYHSPILSAPRRLQIPHDGLPRVPEKEQERQWPVQAPLAQVPRVPDGQVSLARRIRCITQRLTKHPCTATSWTGTTCRISGSGTSRIRINRMSWRSGRAQCRIICPEESSSRRSVALQASASWARSGSIEGQSHRCPPSSGDGLSAIDCSNNRRNISYTTTTRTHPAAGELASSKHADGATQQDRAGSSRARVSRSARTAALRALQSVNRGLPPEGCRPASPSAIASVSVAWCTASSR